MTWAFIKLLIGFVLLFCGGNWLVDGGVSIANRLKISPLVIGMTIVAIGTSAPELLVSTIASIKGSSGIAMGNVIGSNIANIGLILGITSIICPIVAKKRSIIANGGVMILTTLALAFLSSTNVGLSRVDGAILTISLILFILISIITGKESGGGTEDNSTTMALFPSILLIILSCAMLAWGADLLVDNATIIAKRLNVSDKVIGLTIVAIGTSLPELAASLIAATKRRMDISLGNIIGSNIFNILAVLGISSTITPIKIDFSTYQGDYIYALLLSLLLVLFILPWRENLKLFKETKSVKAFKNLTNGRLGRLSGMILLAIYIYYIVSLF